ncbi:MAG: hypothetical protein AB8U25_05595 [Rickettsiales endosymbiont of Dermacentor nuttalli]
MLKLRFTADFNPCAKNGHPPHNTIGVEKSNCKKLEVLVSTIFCKLAGNK